MNRREVLKGFGAIALFASFPAVLSEFSVAVEGAETLKPQFFTFDEFALLEEVVDIILPATKTPGGKATQVPAFIDLVVKDCLSKEDQTRIVGGLNSLVNVKGKSFLKYPSEEKLSILKSIDEKAFKDDAESVWLRIVKKLGLIGYFTSQEGMTKALNYVKVPGNYEGCIPYKKGDKAMAKIFLMYW